MHYNPGEVFKNRTVAIIAQGPTATKEAVEELNKHFPIVAVKDTYLWAPEAVIIYASDKDWWEKRWQTDKELWIHPADKVVLDYQKKALAPDIHWVKCAGNEGFALTSGAVKHGRNSGHQALDLVAGMGASKIILVGYDMRVIAGKTHCHNRHVKVPHSVFDDFVGPMERAAPLLHGKCSVVNTSKQSALSCFPKMSLDKAIEWGNNHG